MRQVTGSVVLLFPMVIGLFSAITTAFLIEQSIFSAKLYNDVLASTIADSYSQSSILHFLNEYSDLSCDSTANTASNAINTQTSLNTYGGSGIPCDFNEMSKNAYYLSKSDTSKLAGKYGLIITSITKPLQIESDKKLEFMVEIEKKHIMPIINIEKSLTSNALVSISFIPK